MNKKEVSIKTKDENLQLSIPISLLINAFHHHPDNMNGDGDRWATVKKDKKQEFIEYLIVQLKDDGDKSPNWALGFDKVFEDIFEDALDDFIDYKEEDYE